MNALIEKVVNFDSNKKKAWCYERVRIMVFNTSFNNISVISWQSVLLVEEIGVHGENH